VQFKKSSHNAPQPQAINKWCVFRSTLWTFERR